MSMNDTIHLPRSLLETLRALEGMDLNCISCHAHIDRDGHSSECHFPAVLGTAENLESFARRWNDLGNPWWNELLELLGVQDQVE